VKSTQLEELAYEAGLDPGALREYLWAEVERRQAAQRANGSARGEISKTVSRGERTARSATTGQRRNPPFAAGFWDGAYRDRTGGLQLAKLALSQLS
jgi:hypothetical protein